MSFGGGGGPDLAKKYRTFPIQFNQILGLAHTLSKIDFKRVLRLSPWENHFLFQVEPF